MSTICKRLVVMFPLLLLLSISSARAAEGPFVGIDLGYSGPDNDNYRAHVQDGGTGNPYAGYMFNDYLGLQGQLHFTFQEPDSDHRGFPHENQTTSLFGGTFGPRLVLPLGQFVELYGTGQGGGFTGLSGRLNHTAPGFSVGGGIDFNVTPQFAVGFFGRWNRAYMSPRHATNAANPDPLILVGQVADQQGPSDARWVTAGVGLKYSFNRPEAAPPGVLCRSAAIRRAVPHDGSGLGRPQCRWTPPGVIRRTLQW